MRTRWLTITAALATLVSAGTALGQNDDTFRWSGVIAAGKTLEVRGVNGDIEATGAAGTTAEVVARKKGEDDDPGVVRIEVVEDAEGVLLCAVYPSPRGEPANTCRRRNSGHNIENNDVEVDFTIRVPAGVLLDASTVNGDVSATGIRADTEVATVNGTVEVSSTGTVSAHTVNGSIDASMGRASWSGELEFHTVNGSVTVEMPAGTNAVVEGQTVTGNLQSDFPLQLEADHEWGPKSFEGRIGQGGGTISIETVNGSIKLVRSS